MDNQNIYIENVNIDMLSKQTIAITDVIDLTPGSTLTISQINALEGVRNLLEAMIDTIEIEEPTSPSGASGTLTGRCEPQELSETQRKTMDTSHSKPLEKSTSRVARGEVSDGSTATYYTLPTGATQLQDLISYKDLNAQIGEIFRKCYRYGQVSHSEKLRDAKGIRYYINAEIKRLETST